jgi:hypothetical protein
LSKDLLRQIATRPSIYALDQAIEWQLCTNGDKDQRISPL